VCQILCNDCLSKSDVSWRIDGLHKCAACSSYNTDVLQRTQPERPAGDNGGADGTDGPQSDAAAAVLVSHGDAHENRPGDIEGEEDNSEEEEEEEEGEEDGEEEEDDEEDEEMDEDEADEQNEEQQQEDAPADADGAAPQQPPA